MFSPASVESLEGEKEKVVMSSPPAMLSKEKKSWEPRIVITRIEDESRSGQSMLIHPNMPVHPTNISVVTIPAPILSASVAGLMAAGSATL